ncbi:MULTISPECIES: ACT domain-containing protein [unclassified Methanocalculus]|uniref:ACT domain-containing protein n=1 Tax=Methanocalculus TaxID=71151 RepID=UPI00269F7B04|nr:hypothetical protein [Methanocalculus sp. AMF5]
MQEEYIIKQISVFSENKPGRLAAIAEALQKSNVNIFAFSIAEASSFGVVRALVDNPGTARSVLENLGFAVQFTDVIAVRMKDEPGGLHEVARILGDAGINIEYAYAYSGRDAAVLILRVSQAGEAISKIQAAGGSLLRESDLG